MCCANRRRAAGAAGHRAGAHQQYLNLIKKQLARGGDRYPDLVSIANTTINRPGRRSRDRHHHTVYLTISLAIRADELAQRAKRLGLIERITRISFSVGILCHRRPLSLAVQLSGRDGGLMWMTAMMMATPSIACPSD